MSNILNKFFESNKTTPVNAFNIFFSIIGIIFVRTFLENFSSPHISGYFFPPYALFVHYIYFYFSIIFSLILLLFFFTKTSLKELFSLIIKLFPVVWLPPLFDLAITSGKGWRMAYLFVGPSELFKDFFTFFGPLKEIGTTPGMRIEIFLIILSSYFFITHKTNSKTKALLGALFTYLLFFIYLTFPSFIMIFYKGIFSNSMLFLDSIYKGSLLESQQLLSNTTINQNYILTLEQSFNVFMSRIFWITSFFQLFAIFFIYHRNTVISWVKNSRWERIFYYCLIGLLGMAIYVYTGKNDFSHSATDILGIIVFFILIAINFWIAVIINDLVDIQIDSISNSDRPLITNAISHNEFILIGIILGIFSISGIVLLNYIPLISLLFFQFVYFIYSSYPLHLKKTFFTSSLSLGMNALLIAMGGFFLLSPDQHLSAFPAKFIWLIFIGFAIVSNIKDIKDYEGDKFEKIYTIPVIFGLNIGKLIISVVCVLFLIIFPIILNNYLLLYLSLVASLLTLYLLNKKTYEEYKVFLLFYLYVIFMLFVFSR